MNWRTDTDEETITLLEVTIEFLIKYFGYSEEKASHEVDTLFNRVIAQFEPDPEYLEDLMSHVFHHEGAWRIACKIDYEGKADKGMSWIEFLSENEEPKEARDYFNQKMGF